MFSWVSRDSSMARVGKGGSDGCATGIRGAVWDGGAVYRAPGGASLVHRICLCRGRQAWRLKARPRVYECTVCHRQESVTAGTVSHRMRTDLSKWFVAAYLMGRDRLCGLPDWSLALDPALRAPSAASAFAPACG
jgi:hypothetical protein